MFNNWLTNMYCFLFPCGHSLFMNVSIVDLKKNSLFLYFEFKCICFSVFSLPGCSRTSAMLLKQEKQRLRRWNPQKQKSRGTFWDHFLILMLDFIDEIAFRYLTWHVSPDSTRTTRPSSNSPPSSFLTCLAVWNGWSGSGLFQPLTFQRMTGVHIPNIWWR